MSPTTRILIYVGLFLAGYISKIVQDYILSPYLAGKAKACEERAKRASTARLVQEKQAQPVKVWQVMPHWIVWCMLGVAILVAVSTIWGRIDAHNQRVTANRIQAEVNQSNCILSSRIKIRQEQALNEQLVLSDGIHDILNSHNEQSNRAALERLEAGVDRTVEALRGLPALPPAIVEDCRDGVLNNS